MAKAKIYMGTSGYYYRDWVGGFYPPGTKPKQYLSYYAQHFPIVEINNTFYRQPSAPNLEKMVSETPKDFLFAIKGHRTFTHEIATEWQAEVKQFAENIRPLAESKKLASILLQFPYSFHYTPPNRTYLAQLCDRLTVFPLSVEFRNREWDHLSVYDELKRREIGVVCTDLPKLKGLPEAQARYTSNIGYIRFHGRNAATWWRGNSTTRYEYLYSREELEEWIPRIDILRDHAKVVIIVFNNHYRGNAPQNALDMRKLLASGP